MTSLLKQWKRTPELFGFFLTENVSTATFNGVEYYREVTTVPTKPIVLKAP